MSDCSRVGDGSEAARSSIDQAVAKPLIDSDGAARSFQMNRPRSRQIRFGEKSRHSVTLNSHCGRSTCFLSSAPLRYEARYTYDGLSLSAATMLSVEASC